MKLLEIVLLVGIFHNSHGAKVLGVFHIDSYSHHILGHRLLEELANRGHEVTMISARKNVETNSNFKSVYLDQLIETLQENKDPEYSNMDTLVNMSPYKMVPFVADMGLIMSEMTLNDKNVQKHLQENHHYDVVIVEQAFGDALKGFCYHYKAPCIGFSSVGPSSLTGYTVGNSLPSSYVPNIFTSYTSKMTLYERTHNLIFNTFFEIVMRFCYLPKHEALMQKHFPGAPSIHDVFANMSLEFLNSHPSISQPMPVQPNMIEIGGIHIEPPKKLPAELQKFLDGAKEGAIYFSLGSNLKSKDLPVKQRDDIIAALSKLKQKVLWKFEDDTLTNLPKNIKVSNWLPQNDILAHPNVKIFITHGGFLSYSEAMNYGVPIVGIPFYGDQRRNMAEMELMGVGIKINFENLNGKTLLSALEKILADKSYAENAQKRSVLMNDRPMTPVQTAVYWVEYVIRHKGITHLKSAAMDLCWYQYWMLDVISLIFIVCLIPLIFLYCLIKKMKKCLCAPKKTEKIKKS